MEDALSIVAGKRIESEDGRAFRARAARFERVVADLGTGDGLFAYRLARRNPSWFCIGIDADARAVGPTAVRARRKEARGGAANAVFVRAGLHELPGPLRGMADRIHVNLPWGTLLRAVLTAEFDALQRIAGLGKTGAAVHVALNESALEAEPTELMRHLPRGYAAAGIQLTACRSSVEGPSTSWGRRLGDGRPINVLRLEGVVEPQRRLVAGG